MMDQEVEQGLLHKLLAMADDELVLGHRNSEWCGHAPILEEDIAFANVALDELGHARIWHELAQPLHGRDVDEMVFLRDSDDYRNVRMVELPPGDWAFTILRQYLFDVMELERAALLLKSGYRPLAEAAAKVRPEELYHVRHTEEWVRRLGLGTPESRRRMQRAVDSLWPAAFQMFAPLQGEEVLVAAGLVPDPGELQATWQLRVTTLLESSSLKLPAQRPGRPAPRTEHTAHLAALLQEMQRVTREHPDAQW